MSVGSVSTQHASVPQLPHKRQDSSQLYPPGFWGHLVCKGLVYKLFEGQPHENSGSFSFASGLAAALRQHRPQQPAPVHGAGAAIRGLLLSTARGHGELHVQLQWQLEVHVGSGDVATSFHRLKINPPGFFV